jgi:FtsH-binding integral membrane protein
VPGRVWRSIKHGSRWSTDPQTAAGGEAVVGRLSVLGALMLYLDFLNLFLFLLRIFGRRC